MPHEVIMPALGMTQDTGLIVSWLKKPGDSVKAGEGLMEVETDKVVLEVEAKADGFLSNVTAEAGEHVPVGNVVAVIVGTSEEVSASSVPVNAPDTLKADEPKPEATQDSTALPHGHEIIMPALGMTQDTGLIVSWQKTPGEEVTIGDVLLEVETDKSVMEVEATHEGYMAAILAEAKQEVPVGSVIAIISTENPIEAISRSYSITTQTATKETGTPPAPAPVSHSLETQTKISVPTGDKILASPKLKRLALEQGLNLALLVQHGIPQPYHVADLETLKNIRSTSNVPASLSSTQTVSSTAISQYIEARVPTSQCDDFLAWMLNDGNIELAPSQLWPRFATIALRKISDTKPEDIIIETRHLSETTELYINADQTPISTPTVADGDSLPTLILRDFTHSAIILSTTNAQVAPIMTIGRTREEYVISLDYHNHHFDENTAIKFLNGFAQCLGEPLRHIL